MPLVAFLPLCCVELVMLPLLMTRGRSNGQLDTNTPLAFV